MPSWTAKTLVPVGTAKSWPECLCAHMPPFCAKLADSLYFWTGSTQALPAGALVFTCAAAAGVPAVGAPAAVATPAPRTTEAPRPAATTAARVRRVVEPEVRSETCWNMKNPLFGDGIAAG